MLEQALLFFDKKRYIIKAVDVCIAAAANALNMNLYIYEKLGKKAVTIQQLPAFKETRHGLFMCYQCAPEGQESIAHYDAIVNVGHIPCSEEQVVEEAVPINVPVTPLEVPAIPAEEGTCNVADVEDIADEEQMWIAPPPLPGACRKRIKGAKGKLNLQFFTDMQPEVADNIPWDVNGNKIYAIPTTEEFWHDKQMDGRHWTFTTSSKKGLDGKCKFGTCQGSLICMNPHCPVFATEGICSQIDFVKHEFKGHTCNSCGYMASREFCGCISH